MLAATHLLPTCQKEDHTLLYCRLLQVTEPTENENVKKGGLLYIENNQFVSVMGEEVPSFNSEV